MTSTLLVLIAVLTVVLFIIARRSHLVGRAIAGMKRTPTPNLEPVWLGVIKRGARLWRSRFRYFRPGPRVPSFLDKNVISPLRDMANWLLDFFYLRRLA